MALSGLEIFKMLPKKNCKECGFPTCLAFAMKLAGGGVEVEKCPHMSDDAKAKLGEASAPPQTPITIGAGDNQFVIGGEIVLMRHEKSFINRPIFALGLAEDDADAEAKLAKAKAIKYDRIGEIMKVGLVAAYGNDAAKFGALVDKIVAADLEAVPCLLSDNADLVKAELPKVADKKPLIGYATEANFEAAVAVAKEAGLPLVVKAPTVEALHDLVEKIHGLDFKNIVLYPETKTAKEELEARVMISRAALKKTIRPLGYPMMTVICDADPYMRGAKAALGVVKYAGLIVLNDIDYATMLPLCALRQNIFTDPQKPMRVEPGIYPIGNPGPESPVLVTTDFALTYFIVSGEIEKSKVPCWLLIPDAGGLSVLTAWAAGKLSGSSITQFVKECGIEEKVTAKYIELPGKIAVLKGELEDGLSDWKVVIGPNEAIDLPKFLKNWDSVK
ncbi:MAG: acetyl-CoA decarbonylase/synthase complex subunit gamma [bacterium]